MEIKHDYVTGRLIRGSIDGLNKKILGQGQYREETSF